jgi:hypothetical protein
MTQGISTETQVALLIAKAAAQDREIAEARADIAALQSERDKALKWGVISLGSAVLGMAYWILEKLIGGHIR